MGGVKPINVPKSQVLTKGKQKGFGLQTAAIGAVMSARGTSVAVANNIQTVWKMADKAARSLPTMEVIPSDILLVQDFLRTEISANFKLVDMLSKGVGVHHSGISDDVRALMKWLAETAVSGCCVRHQQFRKASTSRFRRSSCPRGLYQRVVCLWRLVRENSGTLQVVLAELLMTAWVSLVCRRVPIAMRKLSS